MTILSFNLMWGIVLFGVLLWTTACVALNAALRRGMRIMGLALSYGVLAWMVVDLPWREVAVTWGGFAVAGGLLSMVYELWARRRYAGMGRVRRAIIHPLGLVMWPAMVPDAVGLMFNEAGILPADERLEQLPEVEKPSTVVRSGSVGGADQRSRLAVCEPPVGHVGTDIE